MVSEGIGLSGSRSEGQSGGAPDGRCPGGLHGGSFSLLIGQLVARPV